MREIFWVDRECDKMDVNLVLFKNNSGHKVFSLPDHVTVIGRRHDCDLRIPLSSVSRRHCQLSYNKETLKVRDLDSRNGTYINGKRIDETEAQPGDYLKIGPLTFLLQIDGKPEEISPPKEQEKKLPEEAEPFLETASDEDGFAELETDESDPFLDELEDL